MTGFDYKIKNKLLNYEMMQKLLLLRKKKNISQGIIS